jgi:hypothetical protein
MQKAEIQRCTIQELHNDIEEIANGLFATFCINQCDWPSFISCRVLTFRSLFIRLHAVRISTSRLSLFPLFGFDLLPPARFYS